MTCLLDYLPIYQYAMQGKPKRQDSSFIKKTCETLCHVSLFSSYHSLFSSLLFHGECNSFTWHLKWQWYSCLGSQWAETGKNPAQYP